MTRMSNDNYPTPVSDASRIVKHLDDRPPGDGWRLFQIVQLMGGRYQLIWTREVEVES